jgi:hypothetical protein
VRERPMSSGHTSEARFYIHIFLNKVSPVIEVVFGILNKKRKRKKSEISLIK